MDYLLLPCAAVARFETQGTGYRCLQCGAVVGSVGQSKECTAEADKWKTLEALGGKGWDYKLGQPAE